MVNVHMTVKTCRMIKQHYTSKNRIQCNADSYCFELTLTTENSWKRVV